MKLDEIVPISEKVLKEEKLCKIATIHHFNKISASYSVIIAADELTKLSSECITCQKSNGEIWENMVRVELL